MQGARIGADAAQLPISRQARSYPETLVLYRMRPTVSAQVSRGGRPGRVRYSGLKGAARGEGFMHFYAY